MRKALKRLAALCALTAILAATPLSLAVSAADYFRYPISLNYELDTDDDGFAKGEITVRVNAWINIDECPMEAVMYWADAEGPLAGYSSLARFSLSTVSTTFEFPELQIIPQGADRLRVYTAKKGESELSEKYVEAMLPQNADFYISDEPVMEFAVVSDTHVKNDDSAASTVKFKDMLEDVKALIPDGEGIFINGDIVDGNQKNTSVVAEEFNKVEQIRSSVCPELPIYMAIGNHDLWPSGFVGNTKQTMVDIFLENAKLPDGGHPTGLSYDFWIDGCHFVFLGDDDTDGNYATLNENTLKWLDETIAAGYDDAHRTFLFLHQSLSNTVAGGVTDLGQAWHGVQNVPEVKAVLRKYPDAIMFNGHSHYSMDSVRNSYSVSNYPNTFNTAAVKTLEGDSSGSQGYIVQVYENKVVIKGRDFANDLWKASAQYAVAYGELSNERPESAIPSSPATEKPTETKAPTKKPTATKADTDTDIAESGSDTAVVVESSGCGSVIGATATSVVVVLGAACMIARKKKE